MPSPVRLHLLDRSPRVEKINRALDASWARGWSNYPSLDPDVLCDKAGAPTRACAQAPAHCHARSEDDEHDFLLRLNVLCDALTSEAQLNSLGRTIAHGQITRVIKLRRQLGELWDDKPALLDTTLAPPIIVIGQMRSGTTRIHRLLAADPKHCATRFCDSWSPVPPRSGLTPDMRPVWSALALSMARALNPWLDTVHPFGAARFDEELGWLASALDHSTYEAQWRIPTFSKWSEARDPTPLYREFARILRMDAACAGNADRPRIMKVPQFSEDLPALLAQFPGARLVVSQRDDDAVLQSCVSLVANQMAVQSDTADLGFIEREWRRKLALRAARTQEALADFTGPCVAMPFDELNTDWLGAIARCYDGLGITLTPEATQAMNREMCKAERSDYAAHSAQLSQFDEASQPPR